MTSFNTGFVGRNQLPTTWDTTSAHITTSKKQTFSKTMMKNAKYNPSPS